MTHTQLLNNATCCAELEKVQAIADACSQDLDNAFAEYDAARARTKAAITVHEKNWADVEEARAKVNYLEKFAIYVDFMKGF